MNNLRTDQIEQEEAAEQQRRSIQAKQLVSRMKKQKEYLRSKQLERDKASVKKLEQFAKEGSDARRDHIINKFKVLQDR